MSNIQQHIAKAEAEGRHIEAGFRGLMAVCYPNGVSEEQHNDLRKFFFAGSAYLFNKMLAVMDSDREPTESDMAFMSRLNTELGAFQNDLKNGQ